MISFFKKLLKFLKDKKEVLVIANINSSFSFLYIYSFKPRVCGSALYYLNNFLR